ncbi:MULTISPECIES: LptA/OstA family protein [Methylorubrum]|uniref:LptA/OstA family protein n=1 Tax=Methylorubrum TaxID=2282523 RepID=UPI00209CA2C9|nr:MULTISPECIES: LptA/OstA family protein [Methylorubrum]MCP1548336.1 lipopolysaccharide export system protein LptA [Methylorubrum zatmanii]MCP1555049.1 lipopolysaccharide export system protein LptA [Methylorubrum extorquens]MCP1578639.1 lipopolysaccharide export system protein LptA [Methylorubrum extorquens]
MTPRLGPALAAGLALLLAQSATAAPTKETAKEKPAALGTVGGGKGPIKIDADRLDVFDKENKAIFAGNVVAVQGESTIRCSAMTVHYKRDKDKDSNKDAAKSEAEAAEDAKAKAALGGNGIRKVECAGPVTVAQKDQIATGDNAVFDQEAKRIVLTGNVVLSQCQNVTRGSRLVYDMASGRANMDPVAGGRVSAMFVPGEAGQAKGSQPKGCTQPAIAAKPGAKGADKGAEKPTVKTRAQAN